MQVSEDGEDLYVVYPAKVLPIPTFGLSSAPDATPGAALIRRWVGSCAAMTPHK